MRVYFTQPFVYAACSDLLLHGLKMATQCRPSADGATSCIDVRNLWGANCYSVKTGMN